MSAPTYQGQPCPQGHAGLRYRSNRACVECVKARDLQRAPNRVTRAQRRGAKARPSVQGEILDKAAPFARVEGADLLPGARGRLDVLEIGEALAAAMGEAGRAHVALTLLESGLWQCVALAPGYRNQVTRCAGSPGEALRAALGDERESRDVLLDALL